MREANHVLLARSNEQVALAKRVRGDAVTENIIFSEEEARNVHWPHNDAFVIRARIDNSEVRRIMVDTGSLVNVMYRACFDQMGLGLEQFKSSPETLYGFIGDATVPVGRISLPFTVGDVDRQAATLAEFLIVDYSSAYNVVHVRPAMNNVIPGNCLRR